MTRLEQRLVDRLMALCAWCTRDKELLALRVVREIVAAVEDARAETRRAEEAAKVGAALPAEHAPPDQRLSEIRARLSAATPGPWEFLETLTDDEYQSPSWYVSTAHPAGPDVKAGGERGRDPYAIAVSLPQDAEFVAHAPEDIRYLLELARGVQVRAPSEPDFADDDDAIPPDLDFTNAVRNKYAERYKEGVTLPDGTTKSEREFCHRFMRALGFGPGGMLDSVEAIAEFHREAVQIAGEASARPAAHAPPEPSEAAIEAAAKASHSGVNIAAMLRAAYAVDFGSRPSLAGSPEPIITDQIRERIDRRLGYVLAMAVMQSSAWTSADEELRDAVELFTGRYQAAERAGRAVSGRDEIHD